MKKLLFLMVTGFGAIMFVKGGHITLTPERQLIVAGMNVPLPEVVQNSPIMTLVTTMMTGQLQGLPHPAAAAPKPGAPVPPALPSVTSSVNTYNPNAPAAGHANGADPLNAAATALRGSR